LILAELRVDEADIGNIRLDQETWIYSASEPNNGMLGKVASIGTSARKLGEDNGLSFQVKVILPNQQKSLFPGMSCRAEIVVIKSAAQHTVPISALYQANNQRFVWVLEEGRVSKRKVNVGLSNDTHQVIASGLQVGERVVIGPNRVASKLTEGQRVIVNGQQS
jgi:HlyD family secretion protein